MAFVNIPAVFCIQYSATGEEGTTTLKPASYRCMHSFFCIAQRERWSYFGNVLQMIECSFGHMSFKGLKELVPVIDVLAETERRHLHVSLTADQTVPGRQVFMHKTLV